MAREKSIEIRRTLKRLIPPARLKALAKQTGAVQRERKIGGGGAVLDDRPRLRNGQRTQHRR